MNLSGGKVLDRGAGDVRKEDGRIIGQLKDGTKLIMPNEAWADGGELVKFDEENIYTFNESGEEVYIAVINEGDTDVYYKYDEDSEDVANMIKCFEADESLRINNNFGMLRALMNQDEWDNNDSQNYVFELEAPCTDLVLSNNGYGLDRPNRLRKTYIWSKKIRLAVYKIVRYLPKLITGNFRRKVEEK